MDTKFSNAINTTIQDVREKIDNISEEIVMIPAVLSRNVNGEVSTLTPLSDSVVNNYSNNLLTPDNSAYSVKLALEYIARMGLNTGLQSALNGGEIKELLDNLNGENEITILGNTTMLMNTIDGDIISNETTIENDGLTLIVKDRVIVKVFNDNMFTVTREGITITGISDSRSKDFAKIEVDLSTDGLVELNKFIANYNTIF